MYECNKKGFRKFRNQTFFVTYKLLLLVTDNNSDTNINQKKFVICCKIHFMILAIGYSGRLGESMQQIITFTWLRFHILKNYLLILMKIPDMVFNPVKKYTSLKFAVAILGKMVLQRNGTSNVYSVYTYIMLYFIFVHFFSDEVGLYIK